MMNPAGAAVSPSSTLTAVTTLPAVQPRLIFLRADQASLSAGDMALLNAAKPVSVANGALPLQLFAADPFVVDHAMLLLGQNASRFGTDLSYYLNSVVLFLKRTNGAQFFSMPAGGSDFKRRYSEDIGVTLASLLMVEVFGLQWHTISQIPGSTGPKQRYPDFVGFEAGGGKKVYEAKGTTTPDSIDSVRSSAKEQLASFKEAGVSKYAVVSYITSSPALLPSMMFLSDPPVELPRMSQFLSIALHFQRVLEYSNLQTAEGILSDILTAFIRNEDRIRTNSLTAAVRRRIEDLLRRLPASVTANIASAETYEIAGQVFVGRWLQAVVEGYEVKVFCGVQKQYATSLATSIASSLFRPDGFGTTPFDVPAVTVARTVNVSIFTDGTIFVVEPLK